MCGYIDGCRMLSNSRGGGDKGGGKRGSCTGVQKCVVTNGGCVVEAHWERESIDNRPEDENGGDACLVENEQNVGMRMEARSARKRPMQGVMIDVSRKRVNVNKRWF